MKYFFVNRQAEPTGEHQVHSEDCYRLPSQENKQLLGVFNECKDALEEASRYYKYVVGCDFCCKSCSIK